MGVAFDPDGSLFVASFNTNQVLHYGATGAFLGVFVAAADGLSLPQTWPLVLMVIFMSAALAPATSSATTARPALSSMTSFP